jgi:biopolymer transport protein ExbB
MILKNVPFLRLLAVAAPLLLSATLVAQDPAAAATATEEESIVVQLFQYKNCGTVGYLIVAMSVIATALIIENFISITREKLAPPDLLGQIEAFFNEDDFEGAAQQCESTRCYLTNVIGAGLAKREHAFDTIQAALREMQTEESVKLFQKIGWLSLISALAPMMGLFGTVTGMFFTFSAIAAAGGSVSPAQLAGGIKMALITTIFGLTVAIPVGVMFFTLRNRVIRVSTEINAISEELFERFRAKG